ncbi:MAG TPA: IclR family transcriptional regulator [Geminicoccus sp.]|jgi:DNA-binding IclR family transcriptional regulator|uniref:IclR family transcriptional regulator n=1 Tax=Geminicoccus sp. TaxID=2024832 RepID=UPI002E33A94C|nr:IclR family transcriptional regulator [Geminicoccus sp.]HEX2524990.1 IclR family transcriptional regulator [Geminicoccus sp.]
MLTAEERRAKYSVPAVEKALDVLEYLSDQAVPVSQAQIARALGRQAGEIFRLLTCLEVRGYLRRDADTGGYALTLKLFELSRTHSPYEDLLAAAQPWMRRLSSEVRESCHLSVLYRDRVLVLAQEESPRPFRLSVEVGSLHSPLHTTSGRILLAHLPSEARDALLARLPEWAMEQEAAREAFSRRLEALRVRGHERSEGERFVGTLDLGVPVGSPGSSIGAALTISTLKYKDGPDLDALLPHLEATAAAIGSEAGLVIRGSRS